VVARVETASKHLEYHPSIALIFLIVVTQIDVLNKKNLTVIEWIAPNRILRLLFQILDMDYWPAVLGKPGYGAG
jgi:hypothetical protein